MNSARDDLNRWVEYVAHLDYMNNPRCMVLASGVSRSEATRLFEADRGLVPDNADPSGWSIDAVGPGILIIEDGGYAGTERDLLCSFSRLGRAASIYWAETGVTSLAFAAHGVFLDVFEPMTVTVPTPEAWLRELPHVLVPMVDGLDFGKYWLPSSMTLIERFTGLTLTLDQWLGP